MSKAKRTWLVVAAALAVGASVAVRADDGGDNGMNPMYGDSYATLEGQGHNAGSLRLQPQGAFAAHEMDNQKGTPLMERMQQAQQRMAEQARHNWDAMVQKTHAMTEKVRTAMNTQSATTESTTGTASTPSAASTTSAPAAARPAVASNAPKGLTGSTSAPSAAGQVVASPPQDIGEPMVKMPAQSATDSGVRIMPVNPRGQAPTIAGPSGR